MKNDCLRVIFLRRGIIIFKSLCFSDLNLHLGRSLYLLLYLFFFLLCHYILGNFLNFRLVCVSVIFVLAFAANAGGFVVSGRCPPLTN